MKKKLLLVLITSICGIVAQANAARLNAIQETTTSASAQATQLQPGTVIYAELSKSIDTKKAKVGDPIVAKVTQPVLSSGKLVIPKNSKIAGHITSAKVIPRINRFPNWESPWIEPSSRTEHKSGSRA